MGKVKAMFSAEGCKQRAKYNVFSRSIVFFFQCEAAPLVSGIRSQ